MSVGRNSVLLLGSYCASNTLNYKIIAFWLPPYGEHATALLSFCYVISS